MARRYVRGGWPAALVMMSTAAALPLLVGCAEPPARLIYAERYCYRTLAEVDCHDRPLIGEESRRVGFYDEPLAVEHVPWPPPTR